MFLATDRGHTETDWFRSYNTFRFGNYQHPEKQPFHSLHVLNNDTLAGGRSFSLLVEEDSDIIVIPTVGAIRYNDSLHNKTVVEAGQAQRCTTAKDTTITFENPYAEDPVNFLQLWVKKQPGAVAHSLSVIDFDIENNRNSLVELFWQVADSDSRFFVGKLGGREEINYLLSAPGKGLFLYVLEGAFEVAYRLLETGDSLALWDVKEAEIEALSNDAIIMLVEVPISK